MHIKKLSEECSFCYSSHAWVEQPNRLLSQAIDSFVQLGSPVGLQVCFDVSECCDFPLRVLSGGYWLSRVMGPGASPLNLSRDHSIWHA